MWCRGECAIEVDMRCLTPEQGDDYVARIHAIEKFGSGCDVWKSKAA